MLEDWAGISWVMGTGGSGMGQANAFSSPVMNHFTPMVVVDYD